MGNAATFTTDFEDARLAAQLPYRAYDSEYAVYVNTHSVMAMMECPLLTGSDDVLTQSLVQAFNEMALPKLEVTVRRVTHGRVDRRLNAIANAMRGNAGILGEMAERERLFYSDAAREGFLLPYAEREPMLDSQVFIELTLRCGASHQAKMSQQLVKLRHALMRRFNDEQLTLQSVQPAQFLALMRHHFCQDNKGDWDGDVNPIDELANQCLNTGCTYNATPPGVVIQPARPQDNERAIGTLAVTQFPREFAMGQGVNLLALLDKRLYINAPHTVSLSFTFIADDVAKARANRKYFGLEKKVNSMMVKLFPRLKDEFAEWSFVRERLARDDIHLVYASLLVSVHSTPERLAEDVSATQSLYSNTLNGFTLSHIVDKGVQMSLLLANCPGVLGNGALPATLRKLGARVQMTSYNAVCLSPFVGEFKGSETGMVAPTLRGQTAAVDIYSLPADSTNAAVAAATGSGKSVLVQAKIKQVLGRGGNVWVIDKGASYKQLCQHLGTDLKTVYIDARTLRLNPFSHLDLIKHEQDRKLQFEVIAQLLLVMIYPTDPVSDTTFSLMLEAVTFAYANDGIDATMATVDAALETQLTTRRDSGEEAIATRLIDMRVNLSKYLPGNTYGDYFNSKSVFDPAARFVVLELGGLDNTKNLQRAVLFAMINMVSQQMYSTSRDVKKMCVIDEAWDLLSGSHPHAGEFINKGYRTSRKHGGSFVTIVQMIGDYFKDSISKACWDSSPFKFIMRQNPDVWDALPEDQQSMFPQSHRDILATFKEAKAVGYSSFMLKAGNSTSFHKLMLEPCTRILFSTKAEEYQRVENLVAEGYSVWDAVEIAAREFLPDEMAARDMAHKRRQERQDAA